MLSFTVLMLHACQKSAWEIEAGRMNPKKKPLADRWINQKPSHVNLKWGKLCVSGYKRNKSGLEGRGTIVKPLRSSSLSTAGWCGVFRVVLWRRIGLNINWGKMYCCALWLENHRNKKAPGTFWNDDLWVFPQMSMVSHLGVRNTHLRLLTYNVHGSLTRLSSHGTFSPVIWVYLFD